MLFESINVSSLRQSLYDCKNSLNHNYSDELINHLAGDSWISDTKQHLISSIEVLTTERYYSLNQKIDTYLKATDMIEEYQDLNRKNNEANNKISELEPQLWKSEKYTEKHLKSNGTYEYIDYWEDVEDMDVKNKIESLKSEISSNTSQMDVLKSRISDLI